MLLDVVSLSLLKIVFFFIIVSVTKLSSLGLASENLAQLSAKCQFSHGRRISSISYKPHLEADRIGGAYRILLFPHDIQVLAAVSQGDTYTEVFRAVCPLPSSHNAITNPQIMESSTQRSKNWKINVKSVHSLCLVLRNFDSKLEYDWVNITQVAAICCGEATESGHVSITLTGRFTLFESAVDVDSLQELHASHNLRSALQLVQSNGVCAGVNRTLERMAEFMKGERTDPLSTAADSLTQYRNLFDKDDNDFDETGTESNNEILVELESLFLERSQQIEQQVSFIFAIIFLVVMC